MAGNKTSLWIVEAKGPDRIQIRMIDGAGDVEAVHDFDIGQALALVKRLNTVIAETAITGTKLSQPEGSA